MNIDWNTELADQLDWHWQNHFRPRLDGLSDDEYLWEPVQGCWSIRPRDAEPAGGSGGSSPRASTAVEAEFRFGTGESLIEYVFPEPKPVPVTTIAWRMAHVIVGCLGMRSASHFGGPAMDWSNFSYAGTAAEALDQLDAGYETWMKGVRGLGEAALAEPCGPAEGPFAEYSMAALVLHINRECLHHGAEITLLRDLYRWKGDRDGL